MSQVCEGLRHWSSERGKGTIATTISARDATGTCCVSHAVHHMVALGSPASSVQALNACDMIRLILRRSSLSSQGNATKMTMRTIHDEAPNIINALPERSQ